MFFYGKVIARAMKTTYNYYQQFTALYTRELIEISHYEYIRIITSGVKHKLTEFKNGPIEECHIEKENGETDCVLRVVSRDSGDSEDSGGNGGNGVVRLRLRRHSS